MSSLLTIAHGSRQGASNDEVRQLADQIHAQQVLTSHLGASDHPACRDPRYGHLNARLQMS